jgi:diaminopimelate decarboxylase
MTIFDCDRLEYVAARFGTPCYFTDFSFIEENFLQMKNSFDLLHNSGKSYKILYSMKANSNPFILKFLHYLGAGFDVLSGGELELAFKAGLPAEELVLGGTMILNSLFHEVAKHKIRINLDSIESISRASSNGIKNAGIRVNPLVEAGHHEKVKTATKTTKFGIALSDYEAAKEEFKRNNVTLDGIHYHIGSGISEAMPFVEALNQVVNAVPDLSMFQYLDIGGGYAMRDDSGGRFDFDPLINALQYASKMTPPLVLVECGRYLVANSTFLLTRVVEIKESAGRTFVGVDAGFNDMMRTVLYSAQHPITSCSKDGRGIVGDLVGPICESGDVFRTDANLTVKEGSLVAIRDVGAYGYSLSSNYLVRPRGPEIGAYNDEIFTMRAREDFDDLSRQVNWQEYKHFLS